MSTKAKAKGTKGAAKAQQGKDHSGSKRWKKCDCGNWMHVGSQRCWKCSGKADPRSIMGNDNPYAAYLLAQAKGRNKHLKAQVADKQTQLKAIRQGVKATRARRAVRVKTLVPVTA